MAAPPPFALVNLSGRVAARAVVPCNGCRACCINDMIVLHPECGDDPAAYETVETINPLTGEPALMLAHRPNGECVYLGERGCTIHERAPAICKGFDCRKQFAGMTRNERRAYLKVGLLSKEKLAEGRKRLHTLGARA